MRDPDRTRAASDPAPPGEPTEELSAGEIAARADQVFPAALGPGALLAGRYHLQAELGRGAWSRVFRAHDRITRTDVAVKLVGAPGSAGRAWLDRLGRELRAARQVRHPNVCEVFDVVVEADGYRFLTMPLASGGTLRDTLRDGGPRSWAERLADVGGVVSGVAAMHAAGVVHRDIKPENVLRMADGKVAVSDFGLAVPLERTTEMTLGVGTPVYMAPELLLGAAGNARSDVWSLGVLMHETLFGIRPAESGGAGDAPDGAGALGRRQRAALRRLCKWCLQQDPARRPVDAREVLRALQLAQTSGRLPVRLGPLLRSRSIQAAGAAAVLGALAVVALGWWSPSAVREVRLEGTAGNLTGRTREVAMLPGRVHCLSALGDGSLGIVWGEPRQAVRLDPASGRQQAWPVPPESYALPPSAFPDPLTNNCPQVSPDGRRLLFASTSPSGQRGAFVQDLPAGPATYLTPGEMPLWHPGGELVALKVDGTHPGILNLTTRQIAVLPQPRPAKALMILELQFTLDGRQLLVRSSDSTSGYGITRYELDSFRVAEELVLRGPDSSSVMRIQLGAADGEASLVHAMMPDGTFGVARLDWRNRSLRWVGELAPFDLTRSVLTSGAGLMLVARRLSSELQVLRDGQVVRSIAANGPAFFGEVNARGDVVVQIEHQGQMKVVVYRAGSDTRRVLGDGPLSGSPGFTADGAGVVFTRGDAARSSDTITFCNLEGQCRSLVVVPTADFPALSPAGDQVAYVAWSPYPHVALASVASGTIRILSSSLVCPPRWHGGNIWLARGSSERFDWVELDARTGQGTGRKLTGSGHCGAAEPGPGGILAQRLRIIHHESSRLMTAPGLL